MTDSVDPPRSPFIELVGATIEEVREGYARLSLKLEHWHTNPNGVMHGGVVTTLLDEALRGDSSPSQVFALHKADPLVRCQRSGLERSFGRRDILCYLLVDGEIRGAIRGHWGFRPYDVEDVALLLPRAEQRERRFEILEAVRDAYPPPRHQILRYAGRPMRWAS